MAKFVTVTEGDSLLSLAYTEGFLDPQIVWNDPGNAELRQKRKNPEVLAPGDRVFIPDKQARGSQVATGASYKFQLGQTPAYFSLFLHDECGQPYAGCRYRLTIGPQTYEGKTGSDGLICHPIRPDVHQGGLTLWPNPNNADESYHWDVQVGGMDPAETVRGIKGRLRNLGYHPGEINDEMDDETREALRTFQRHLGQENPSGEIDDATRAALISLHHDQ